MDTRRAGTTGAGAAGAGGRPAGEQARRRGLRSESRPAQQRRARRRAAAPSRDRPGGSQAAAVHHRHQPHRHHLPAPPALTRSAVLDAARLRVAGAGIDAWHLRGDGVDSGGRTALAAPGRRRSRRIQRVVRRRARCRRRRARGGLRDSQADLRVLVQHQHLPGARVRPLARGHRFATCLRLPPPYHAALHLAAAPAAAGAAGAVAVEGSRASDGAGGAGRGLSGRLLHPDPSRAAAVHGLLVQSHGAGPLPDQRARPRATPSARSS